VTHKIMVVDDNTATRRMVRNALQRNGHHVIEAPDGKTARELMVREHPRVVLQDLMLPDADGFELVGELRNLAGQDVSILAFSGFVSKLDEARVSSVGFDDIITKPIAPSRLVPLIEAHLPAQAPSAERFGAGRRIVFADDDPMQLKLASFRLGRLGFTVETAPDGRAALDAINRSRPDAVVSDVMMPELDGFGLAIALRQDPELRELPLLLVTSSYVETTDRELARRAGATDLVLRTPELTEVIDLLRVTLDGQYEPPVIAPEAVPELERERNRRVFRQLERQVLLNTGLAKRCSALASELTVLTGISEAVLKHRDVDAALDEALAACFDAGGISVGALYLYEANTLRVRPLGGDPQWSSDQLPTFFGHEHVLRDVIAAGKPLYLPSDQLDVSIGDDLLSHCRATALLVVPLIHLGAPLGALLMAARGRELDQEDWSAFGLGVATQITHVLALARVYAEREEAERRATEHAAVLDALVSSAPDFVLKVDLDGTIRFINRFAGDLRPDQVIGSSLFAWSPAPDQQATLRAAMARMLETGGPTEFEGQGTRPDGSVGWYSARIGPVKDAAGKIVAAVVISRDVSDKKQTEMQLMLADRMASVGTLAAGVAHEINNPLASVIANLDMAVVDVRDFPDPSALPRDLLEELRDARAAADRVREIVRDLKIFSRAEDDKRGPVDVEQVLESTLRMAWNEIRHRAKLVKNYHKVPFVDANESRLGQVFLNLLVNAVQAIPEGRYDQNQITVSTGTDASGRVVVSIADTGAGIPTHVRSRLFTPFFTTKPVGVGTGLGLAISHRIVTSFGGTITFETSVGKGTEFHVSLPCIENVEIPVVGRATTRSASPRRGRVLVVDDEDMLTQAICRYLATNHDVAGVSNGRAALDLLTGGERYDIILCDLMMPQVTGMELYAEVKRLDPEQASKIVFLTGGAFTANAREFLDSTPNRRLEKPFDLKTLRRLVNDMLG
jgi:PAS domain S-box-containing protein